MLIKSGGRGESDFHIYHIIRLKGPVFNKISQESVTILGGGGGGDTTKTVPEKN